MKIKLTTVLAIGLLMASCTSNAQHKDHNKSNKHMNKSNFDDLVERFDNPERDKWQKPDLVIKKLGDLSKKTVGDLGSGTGYFSFRLAEKAKKVIAIDVDERFLEFIDKRKTEKQVKNLVTRFVGYNDPKLADNELDVLITVNTYHHIENRVEYFKKCLQGLAKDGILCIVDFKKEETGYGPPLDHRFEHEKVVEEIEKSGFKDITVDENSLAHQYIILAKKNN